MVSETILDAEDDMSPPRILSAWQGGQDLRQQLYAAVVKSVFVTLDDFRALDLGCNLTEDKAGGDEHSFVIG